MGAPQEQAFTKVCRQTTLRTKRSTPVRHYGTQPPSEQQTNFSTLTEPTIHPVFEPVTGTFQYVIADHASKASVIIDPVLDFDPSHSSISTKSADDILSLVATKGYNVHYILETHAHADHLSAASYLQAQLSKTGTRPDIGIGQRIGKVQQLFGQRYGVLPREYNAVFDLLFSDNETFQLGTMQIEAIHLPGHTPDHMGYCIGSNVFCGDSLFHTDVGTARTDFPGGSAHDLWESSQKLLALPDETKIWTGHDYPPEGRKLPVPFMTVKQHKEGNKHVMAGRSREEFVKMRRQRDAALGAPRLLHQSLQINVRGGRLPETGESGQRVVKVPLKLDGAEAW
ncbi:hypothetical protein OPT61_g5775 [Boeremia exigua]|uniref:Uncharacterized protein n=1 Tax=Boeremia exigua TaxID=749465 RepID=A0ACC2I983_9PLEO|nr:hypothetical protein OPT61_g5775 [Boeremia exigua]